MITLDEIRPLDSAIDSVAAVQSGAWSVSVSSLPADVDIRDLAFATDSVTSHQGGEWVVKLSDGTDTLAINADGSLNVVGTVTVDDVAADVAFSKVAVTTSSVVLVASALANRRGITIQNLGAQDIFIGKTTATLNDIKIPKFSSAFYRWGASVPVAAICASGSSDVRIVEEA